MAIFAGVYMKFGGKADNLVKLSKDFLIPDFFVIAPDEPLEHVLERFDSLGADAAAVRSSAVNEDGKDAAWAGQLETLLDVERGNLIEAIEQCRRSADSVRALAYAEATGLKSGAVAVIVQKMLQPVASGVSFSKHPVTGEEKVVVEAVRGVGEQLVGGFVTPDTYVEGGECYLSGAEATLRPDELQNVIDLTRQVEAFFGHPIDIEWAYESEKLYLLQARPITTL